MDARIWLLAFGNFAVGTGSMIVTGLLDAIAADLQVSISAAGQLTTIFAVTVAIAGPLLATLTGGFDRRTLLVVALSIFCVGTLGAVLATDYASLAASRVLAGLGASMYTPHASTAGALIAGPLMRGRAIATVFAGYVVATVIGVPLTTAIGAEAGWRVAFGAVAVLPLLGVVGLLRLLPRDLRAPRADSRAWGQLLRSAAMMLMIGTTMLQLAGQLVVFVYLTPLLKTSLGIGSAAVGWMFMVYGLANGAGMVVVARTIDRVGAARLTNIALAATLLAMLLLPFALTTLPGAVAIMVFWGLGSFAINAGTQARLVSAAPWLATVALPLNSTAINLGQAIGAIVGGWVIAHHDYGALPWSGAAILVIGALLSVAALYRPLPRPPASA